MYSYIAACLLIFLMHFSFTAIKSAITDVVLIPVGNSVKIQCDGKRGGSYQWKGHDFTMTLPPDCANGTVTITLEAYLPSSTCLASAVFDVRTNKKLKKPVSISFPHWVNIISETDKEKLCFLIFHNDICEVQKGSFEVGQQFGSIEVSEFHLISIGKDFAMTHFNVIKAKFDDNNQLFQPQIYSIKSINLEEGLITKSNNEATENNYIDLLFSPERPDENWRIYCIAIDNPTYISTGKLTTLLPLLLNLRNYSI